MKPSEKLNTRGAGQMQMYGSCCRAIFQGALCTHYKELLSAEAIKARAQHHLWFLVLSRSAMLPAGWLGEWTELKCPWRDSNPVCQVGFFILFVRAPLRECVYYFAGRSVPAISLHSPPPHCLSSFARRFMDLLCEYKNASFLVQRRFVCAHGKFQKMR